MLHFKFYTIIVLIQLMILSDKVVAQDEENYNSGSVTAAQFLNLNSDVISQGMGNLRNSNPNSVYSISNNLAKINYVSNEHLLQAFGIVYNPLVFNIAKDVKILNLSTIHLLGGDKYNSNYVSFGVHYLGYGDINYTDQQGNNVGFHRPNEFSVSLGYTKRFGDFFALGVTPKYIRTNLTGNGYETYNLQANTFATDLSLYGEFSYASYRGEENSITYGISAQNIGFNVDYKIENITSKLPTNISGGIGVKSKSDNISYLLAAEVNSPIYSDQFIAKGASKLGFSIGGEFSMGNLVFLRSGFIKESGYRNNVKMITFGAGLSINVSNMPIQFNGSYQMPMGNNLIGLRNNFAIGLSTAILDK